MLAGVRRVIVLGAMGWTVGLGACGGGGGAARGPAAVTPPIGEQVRTVLMAALAGPALRDPLSPTQPGRLPFVAVTRCQGPPRGGAGAYRCTTTPRGPHGVRTIIVDVKPGGTWSMRPVAVEVVTHGQRRRAMRGVFGAGLRVGR